MRKQNLLLSIILVAVCVVFYYMTSKLPSEATIYPLFVITLLFLLTLIQLFISYFKKNDEESTSFKNLEFKQLLFVTISSGVYVFLMNFVGYVTTTLIYVAVILLGLGVNKKTSFAVSFGFAIIVFVIFKVLLRVPLPRGFII